MYRNVGFSTGLDPHFETPFLGLVMKSFFPVWRILFFLYLLCPGVGLAQTVHVQDFNDGISPWVETTYDSDQTPNVGWSSVSSGSDPSCSPQEGSGMARFNSYYADSGDESRIRSPDLDLTGAEVAEIRFWMFRDSGQSSDDDLVRLQMSIDGGDKYFSLQTYYRYTNGAVGWQEKVVPIGYFTDRSSVRVALRARADGGGNNIFVDNFRVTKSLLPAGAQGKDCSSGAECDSGVCGLDPFGAGRCRDAGTSCIGANREPVASGQTLCVGLDLGVCLSDDTWDVTDCFNDCGAYLDVHSCEHDGAGYYCTQCDETCVYLFGISQGCDDDAYCDFYLFGGDCIRKKSDGDACDEDRQCLSGNCVASPQGQKYCAPEGEECVDNSGQVVPTDSAICAGGDRYLCQLTGWSITDCYTNCGYYDDVDQCTDGVCAQCPDYCTTDDECKPGIYCINLSCEGDLPQGSTCQVPSQCASGYCVDGRCCQDLCSAPCYRCDVDDSGICKPIPSGQDPDGECAGEGVCAGACNGMGGCDYPTGAVCNTCTRCDNQGRCSDFVPAGTDPDDECPVCQTCSGSQSSCVAVPAGQDPINDCQSYDQFTCGLDGACDGFGACRKWPQGTPCGTASCNAGTEVRADTCDGQGECVDGGVFQCAPYRCADAEHCAQSCQAHSVCVTQAYCSNSGTCEPDLGDGSSCDGVVYPGLLDDSACMGGYCFDDDFDGSGAFCTSNPSGCVHDGELFNSGYTLCSGDDWFKTCLGGVDGWSQETSCSSGVCDAGAGPGSGVRQVGRCDSGPGGGCSSECVSCEPFLADGASCKSSCSSDSDCWPSYECSANKCVLPEGIGDLCESQSDCTAGICVDGRCCADACSGPCMACNLPGKPGICSPVPVGTDPDDECPADDVSTCGSMGSCDGSGACSLWPQGQLCMDAHCEGESFLSESFCDGAGHCVPSEQQDCTPGVCTESGCQNDCSSHEDCQVSAFCSSDGTCQPDLLDGENCYGVVLAGLDDDAACLGGYCFEDGWSTQGAYCTGQVDACVAEGVSYQPGYRLCSGDDWFKACLGGEAGWGPEVDCQGPGVCDAGGGPGSGVTPAQTCTPGTTGGCVAECSSCYPYLAIAAGQCAETCGEDADCWPGHVCNAGQCEPRDELGRACSTSDECGGFRCVDGVCCNLPCDSVCLVCDDPVALGVCLPSALGTDPDDECAYADGCGNTGQCDGMGKCDVRPAGTPCSEASCSDGILVSPGLCNGKGDCVAGLQHRCRSGACLGSGCAPEVVDGGGDDADGGVSDGSAKDDGPLLVAEAGPMQVVKPGSKVIMDGSLSKGPDGVGLDYRWEQTSGPIQVELSSSTTPKASFFASEPGVYVFELVVSDGQGHSSADFAEVRVVSLSEGCSCGSAAGGSSWWLVVLLSMLVLFRSMGSWGTGRS